ncbi:MAG: CPBP family intramembrane metalloprotease [Acidobacteriaceae bacterium]|nr:CPBP family intramembrane metalloprotease [Acidobacteriaceae bacterium]
MASESKSFGSPTGYILAPVAERGDRTSESRNLIEIGLVYGLILVAVWTPQGHLNSLVSLAALCLTILLTALAPYSFRELGLTRPLNGANTTLALGGLLIVIIGTAGMLTRAFGPPQHLPLHRAWQYAIWALLQEFLLQSFMFTRLESIFGSRRGVFAAASLFAIAHFPSPLLTVLSFLGAIFFCETFRRYRNLYPLGLVHAGLGLTVAASLPDPILHHMRVGLGYLMYHV